MDFAVQMIGDGSPPAAFPRVFPQQDRQTGMVRQLLDAQEMHNERIAQVERFFAFHLQTVKARLEKNTERAIERQRAERRKAIRREALLDEKTHDLPEGR